MFSFENLMPLKFFWDMEARKFDINEKCVINFKKLHFSEKSKQVFSFCKIKSVQAHEIGGLALQKKKLEKIVLTIRTTGTNVDFC